MHTIREQYELITSTDKETIVLSDYEAMLDWLAYWKMEPCTNEKFGAAINAVIVSQWIVFRDTLVISSRYDREFIEQRVLQFCSADDHYDLADTMHAVDDCLLIAIGRLFYDDYDERVLRNKAESDSTIAIS